MRVLRTNQPKTTRSQPLAQAIHVSNKSRVRWKLYFYHNCCWSRNLTAKFAFVDESPYHAARVNVSRNFFFSARALKKNSLTLISWSVLLSTTSTRHNTFPKHFFVLFLHVERGLQTFLKGKSNGCKKLIYIMQRVHFQVRVGLFNCPQILTIFLLLSFIMW